MFYVHTDVTEPKVTEMFLGDTSSMGRDARQCTERIFLPVLFLVVFLLYIHSDDTERKVTEMFLGDIFSMGRNALHRALPSSQWCYLWYFVAHTL